MKSASAMLRLSRVPKCEARVRAIRVVFPTQPRESIPRMVCFNLIDPYRAEFGLLPRLVLIGMPRTPYSYAGAARRAWRR